MPGASPRAPVRRPPRITLSLQYHPCLLPDHQAHARLLAQHRMAGGCGGSPRPPRGFLAPGVRVRVLRA